MSRRARFDAERFYSALDEVRLARGLQWRQVAEESGVAASTLTRISQGRHPDVDGLTALLIWAELDANEYLGVARPAERTIATVTDLIRNDANLKPQDATALAKIIRLIYDILAAKPKS